MSAEYTPGPWEASNTDDDTTYVRQPKGGRFKIEGAKEADARLIAAAPDLLEAAKLALQNQDENGYIGVQSCAEIRAAIAKAEGE